MIQSEQSQLFWVIQHSNWYFGLIVNITRADAASWQSSACIWTFWNTPILAHSTTTNRMIVDIVCLIWICPLQSRYYSSYINWHSVISANDEHFMFSEEQYLTSTGRYWWTGLVITSTMNVFNLPTLCDAKRFCVSQQNVCTHKSGR